MDFSEKYGKDIEEAVNLALDDLGLTEEEVEITVLEQPSKGFLGIGSKLAKVRVERKKSDTEKNKKNNKQADKIIDKSFSDNFKNITENKKEKTDIQNRQENSEIKIKRVSSERPDDLVEVNAGENKAGQFIVGVIEKMGLDLSITCMANDECVYITIEGKDSGTVIGKRGQTLDALQYLTSLVANKSKKDDKYIRVILDAENYRAKREHTLEQLANRLAGKVMRTGRNVRLEPMNPYERKVIHATLQSNPDVHTISEGNKPYRRVIIQKK